MSTPKIILLVFITSCFLFGPVTSPPLPGHSCGLASHRKFGENYKENIQRRKFENKDFRRQARTRQPRWDKKAQWRIKDPQDLWYERPTMPTSRIFWNLTKHRCDYMRFRCMTAYKTGILCARTIDYMYRTFINYCAMQHHNCVKLLDQWSIAYMGYCTQLVTDRNLYVDMNYDQMSNNSKLKQMYVADLGDDTEFESFMTYAPTEAPNTTTVLYESFNHTDDLGDPITIEEGVYATFTARVTITTTTPPPTTNCSDSNETCTTTPPYNETSSPTTTPGDGETSSPTTPGGDETSLPTTPGGDETSSPTTPGGDETSSPTTLGGDETSSPSTP